MTMRRLFAKLIDVIESLDPPIKHDLLPPALASDISAAEAKLGLVFPKDLKSLLLCTNGQTVEKNDFFRPPAGTDPIFPVIRFGPGVLASACPTFLNGAQAIVNETLYLRWYYQELKDAGPFEIYGPAYYHDQVIGFTQSGDPNSLVIDLQPAPGGNVGQVVVVSTQPFQIAVLAPSLSSFLELVLEGYKSGRFRLRADSDFRVWGDE